MERWVFSFTDILAGHSLWSVSKIANVLLTIEWHFLYTVENKAIFTNNVEQMMYKMKE